GSAISSLRTLHGAQMTYSATSGNGQFAGTAGTAGITPMTEMNAVGLVDAVLATGTKSSYAFVGDRTAASTSAPATFYFSGFPTSSSGLPQTGTRRFGIATAGVIVADTADLGNHFDAAEIGTCQTAPTTCGPLAN